MEQKNAMQETLYFLQSLSGIKTSKIPFKGCLKVFCITQVSLLPVLPKFSTVTFWFIFIRRSFSDAQGSISGRRSSVSSMTSVDLRVIHRI